MIQAQPLPANREPVLQAGAQRRVLHLSFFGEPVEVWSNDAKFLRGIAGYCYRQVEEGRTGSPAIRFTIDSTPPWPSTKLDDIRSLGPLTREGMTPDGPLLEIVEDDASHRWIITPKAAARIDLDSLAVEGAIFENEATTTDNMRHVVCFFFVLTLQELLKSRRLFYLHAAALADPKDRLVLFPGQAGDGKSTIAVSLLESGWSYLGDDAVFLDLRGDRLGIHGFQKGFHINPDMARHFPRLSLLGDLPTYQAGNPKKEIDPRTLYPDREIAVMDEAAAILFPSIVDDEEADFLPMGHGEALAELMHLSSLQLMNSREVRSHVEALKRLARARCARFRHGRALYRNPQDYAAVITRFLDGDPR